MDKASIANDETKISKLPGQTEKLVHSDFAGVQRNQRHNKMIADISETKPKRAKPFAANNASVKHLEAEGWTVAVVEQRIPKTFITRDAFGFADLLACSPSRGVMLVQVTGGLSTSNYHARVAKTKAEPRHAIWLASGGRIQIHSWEGKGKQRTLRVLELTKQ